MILCEVTCGVVILNPCSNPSGVAQGFDALRRAMKIHEVSFCHDQDWPSLLNLVESLNQASKAPVTIEVI